MLLGCGSPQRNGSASAFSCVTETVAVAFCMLGRYKRTGCAAVSLVPPSRRQHWTRPKVRGQKRPFPLLLNRCSSFRAVLLSSSAHLLIRLIHQLIPASVHPCATLATHNNKGTRLLHRRRLFHQGSPPPRDTCSSYVSCGSVLFVYYPKRK
jgi:hypothetical protein